MHIIPKNVVKATNAAGATIREPWPSRNMVRNINGL
jgi:hypothetical protein